MSSAPLPAAEAARLAALRALEVLDTEPEAEFDALVRAASALCGAPISLVSLIDADRQWFKAKHGLEGLTGTSRDIAFCAHAILSNDVMVVDDASADPRFADNPLVTGAPGIRFYAGAPIRLRDGHCVGTLCAIDHVPRQLDPASREILSHLAVAAARALEGRHAIGALRSATVALADANSVLRTTLNSIADAVLATDARGLIVGINPAAERLIGRPEAHCRGLQAASVLNMTGRGLKDGVQSLLDRARRGRPVKLPADARLTAVQGCSTDVDGVVSLLRGDDEILRGVVLVMRDVGPQRRAQSELSHQARHDALTGLANRREFESRLQQALFRTRTTNSECTLMLIDLDHFKLVNDQLGHAAGDAVLREVAQLLRDSVRTSDLISRVGGDEFAVILERCQLNAAQRLAEQMCERFDRYRFVHEGQSRRIGISAGLAAVQEFDNVELLLKAADRCCYAAKEAGRGRAVAWVDGTPGAKRQGADSDWVARIEGALDEDCFELYGQLVLPLHPEAGVVKAELLLRLREPDGSVITPGAFLPAAERFHLMSRIDRWVLQRAVRAMATGGVAAGFPRIGINLSGQSLSDVRFQAWALSELTQSGAAVCARLTLEITETVAISHLDEASRFFADVRALGVRIALDDFGAGAASFVYLKRLPVDYLKIDGQFVRGLLTDPIDAAAVASFVQFSNAVGIKTVAEFVDCHQTLERLRVMGVGFAQGFLLHRPEPLAELAGRWPSLANAAAGGVPCHRPPYRSQSVIGM